MSAVAPPRLNKAPLMQVLDGIAIRDRVCPPERVIGDTLERMLRHAAPECRSCPKVEKSHANEMASDRVRLKLRCVLPDHRCVHDEPEITYNGHDDLLDAWRYMPPERKRSPLLREPVRLGTARVSRDTPLTADGDAW